MTTTPDKPVRIQRKRTKGWKMPPNTIYVGRPSKWGNPHETAEEFEMWLCNWQKREAREELKGKNLACWCSLDKKCHADILLKIANEE